MSVDAEAALAELGARWDLTIPHVRPEEVIGLVVDEAESVQQLRKDETTMRPRSWSWLLAAAAVLVIGLIGGLIVSSTNRGSENATPGPAGVEDERVSGVGSTDPADQSPATAAADATPVSSRSPVILGDDFGTALIEPLERLGFDVDDQGVASSSLARPPFYDWPANLTELLGELPAGVPVIVTFGGNDSQDLVLADETLVASIDDPLWASEYRDRVAAVMNRITNADHPLIWVGVPTPPDRFSAALGAIRDITVQVRSGQRKRLLHRHVGHPRETGRRGCRVRRAANT